MVLKNMLSLAMNILGVTNKMFFVTTNILSEGKAAKALNRKGLAGVDENARRDEQNVRNAIEHFRRDGGHFPRVAERFRCHVENGGNTFKPFGSDIEHAVQGDEYFLRRFEMLVRRIEDVVGPDENARRHEETGIVAGEDLL